MHCGALGSIPGPHPLCAGNTAPSPAVLIVNVSRFQCALGASPSPSEKPLVEGRPSSTGSSMRLLLAGLLTRGSQVSRGSGVKSSAPQPGRETGSPWSSVAPLSFSIRKPWGLITDEQKRRATQQRNYPGRQWAKGDPSVGQWSLFSPWETIPGWGMVVSRPLGMFWNSSSMLCYMRRPSSFPHSWSSLEPHCERSDGEDTHSALVGKDMRKPMPEAAQGEQRPSAAQPRDASGRPAQCWCMDLGQGHGSASLLSLSRTEASLLPSLPLFFLFHFSHLFFPFALQGFLLLALQLLSTLRALPTSLDKLCPLLGAWREKWT